MTWVCAASTIYGYGALFSDVQVKFRSHETADLVQKAYPLGDFAAAGFAGSVRIGFALIDSLRDFLKASTGTLDPKSVSMKWANVAKSVFDRAASREQIVPGTSILLVSASPTESCDLGAKIYFTRFSAPDFRPLMMGRPIKMCSIGSGAKVSEYKRSVKPLLRLTSGIVHAEVMNPQGWARELGFCLSRVLADHPKHGISQHLHYVLLQPGSVFVETNDENIFPPDGPPIRFRMPNVANTYEQFLNLSRSQGYAAAGAAC
jgi:hypothetical protein